MYIPAKWPYYIQNGQRIYQHFALTYKALENFPKFGFLVCKETIWQPWWQPQKKSENAFRLFASEVEWGEGAQKLSG
jgi:hypothetical protein